MTRQEIKLLVYELDSNLRQAASLHHILEGETVDAGGRIVTEQQLVLLSKRIEDIQGILDESGEDIGALRQEKF